MFRLRWLPGDDTIFLNVLRSSSDPWSESEIPVLITGAGLIAVSSVIFRPGVGAQGRFYHLVSICFFIFSFKCFAALLFSNDFN